MRTYCSLKKEEIFPLAELLMRKICKRSISVTDHGSAQPAGDHEPNADIAYFRGRKQSHKEDAVNPCATSLLLSSFNCSNVFLFLPSEFLVRMFLLRG